jgi:hypothetical protein
MIDPILDLAECLFSLLEPGVMTSLTGNQGVHATSYSGWPTSEDALAAELDSRTR